MTDTTSVVVPVRCQRPSVSLRRRAARIAAIALLAFSALPDGELFAQGPPAITGPAVILEGELEVLYEDANTGSRLLYFLQTVPGRVPLRFRGRGPDLPSGSRVRVTGNLADGAVTPTSISTIAVPAARTFGPQPVLVILFNFSNNVVEPYGAAAIEAINAQVREFYLENSYQQAELSFTVTGWHTIDATNATCDYSSWANLADAAAGSAGFEPTAFARRIYAFPQTSACAWWGMGNVGGPRSWINGSYATRVVAHEQGHNFGNRHSHARRCDSAGCVNVDYGDDRDVMGAGGVVGHMNAFQKERLGWLNYETSPTIQEVSASGDYWIDNFEVQGAGNKGLKIWNAANGTFYYVESRDRVGFDASLPPGVVLHTGAPANSDSSYQLDLAPASPTYDSTLDVGETLVDPALGVSIAPLSSGLGGALVRVTFDTEPCVSVAPTVSLSPASQTGAAGATFIYTMTATNNNPNGCPASPMTFSTTVPNGWSSSFNPASASLAPGESVATTLSVISSSAVTGASSFTASAADGRTGLAGSAQGAVTLVGNLTVNASAIVSKTRNSGSAKISVSVSNGVGVVAGANVTLTITKPNGATSTLTATTNNSGVAVANYSLRSKDPRGTYEVRAVASAGGVTGSATTSFYNP